MALSKLSEQLHFEAMKEENDFKAFAMHSKAHKQEKREAFEDEILPKIKASDKVSFVTDNGHFFKIGFKDGGIYDYYPQKNRLFRNKPAKWYYNGSNLILSMI